MQLVLFDNRIGKFPKDRKMNSSGYLESSKGDLGIREELGVRERCAENEFAMSKFYGQATKGTRWMPRRVKAMKDVVSCDKLWRGANNP